MTFDQDDGIPEALRRTEGSIYAKLENITTRGVFPYCPDGCQYGEFCGMDGKCHSSGDCEEFSLYGPPSCTSRSSEDEGNSDSSVLDYSEVYGANLNNWVANEPDSYRHDYWSFEDTYELPHNETPWPIAIASECLSGTIEGSSPKFLVQRAFVVGDKSPLSAGVPHS